MKWYVRSARGGKSWDQRAREERISLAYPAVRVLEAE